MLPEDMYVMDKDGNILTHPIPKPPPHKAPKCSECAPLFLKVCLRRDLRPVITSQTTYRVHFCCRRIKCVALVR